MNIIIISAILLTVICIDGGLLQLIEDNCINCKEFNRFPSILPCAKSIEDCGKCISLSDSCSDESLLVNIIMKKSPKRRAVTSSNNKSSDVQSTNVSPAIYVACVFGGLCIGFAIGGVISLFAYQCYFKQRYLKKSETTKSFEMEPMCQTKNGIGKSSLHEIPL